MAETEQQILTRLGVPTGAKYVLIYDQAAHCDYDWIQTFENYYTTAYSKVGVKGALNQALALLNKNSSAGPNNYYSMCEMDFLRKFVEDEGQTAIDQINAAGSFFRIVGGGITSPDNLLCSGEGFIRNFLLGKLWLSSQFPQLLPLKHCWIPDDFGHDPELPVVLQALGLISAAFWRIPGASVTNANQNQSVIQELQTNGVDFFWQASDGSQVFAHWLLMPGYPMGSNINNDSDPVSNITSYLTAYGSPNYYACTPYLYLPNDNDFQEPIANLLADLSLWNNGTGYTTSGVFLAQASFDDFVSLVRFHSDKLKVQPFVGQPYWTGHYASQPAMKILHYGATRSLLAAEVFGLLAALNSTFWSNVAQAWNDFVPSTHHDYICGTGSTSVDGQPDVYNQEQLPNLIYAATEASQAAQAALMGLAMSVSISPQSNEVAVLVANPSGVPFSGLVELPSPSPTGMNGLRVGSSIGAVQGSAEGGLIFFASAGSMGYSTANLTPHAPATSSAPLAKISTPDGGETYVLSNNVLTVTIAQSANWGITSILESENNSLLSSGHVGNGLIFYQDAGDVYEFGNEYTGTTNNSTFEVENVTIVNGPAQVLESGPLRVRLSTSIVVTTKNGSAPQTYVREYCLVLNEPLLRMTTTGAAPAVSGVIGYSIMTSFPLAQAVSSIVQGTACHWTNVQPLDQDPASFPPPIFQATHRFLIPQATDNTVLAAVYHPEVPAWAYTGNGTLIGCLFRNTPGNLHGAHATDTSMHTLHYALRTPSGLGNPSTGQPLAEALNYTQPAVAMLVPTTGSGQLPSSFSMASVSQGTGAVLAAKPSDVAPGTIILRLYQPNVTTGGGPQSISVSLGAGQPSAAIAVTALEDPITQGAPAITITSDGFTIAATNALNTVQVTLAAAK